MSDSIDRQNIDLINITGDIVRAYISSNSVQTSELASIIQGVHATLRRLGSGAADPASEEVLMKPTPAEIRKSVTPGGIISFLDGKTYKTLKRHLRGHGLDPHSYRQRYGLRDDYPMVAPDYAAQRSALAKSFGLRRVGDRNKKPRPKGRS